MTHTVKHMTTYCHTYHRNTSSSPQPKALSKRRACHTKKHQWVYRII